MILRKLIRDQFYILMSQYSQVKKFMHFFGCAIIVVWLHTARKTKPDIPQTHPSASKDANRHRQTSQDTDRCYLRMSGGVIWRLLLSVGMSCSLEKWRCLVVSVGCLLGVCGISLSGGCQEYLSGSHGNWRRLNVFGGYMGSRSLQYGAKNTILAQP